MTNGIQEVDQEMLSTIKRHAGLGMALGIAVAIAGVLAIVSPFVAGISVALAVGVLLIAAGVSSDLARRLASEGFAVLAVDLYRRLRDSRIEDPGRWMRSLSDPEIQLSVGFTARVAHSSFFQFSYTNNFINYDNTPDLVFHVGFSQFFD